ncbi:MAG: type III pantothenate kinase [Cyclobacteriaceae bacterium]
MNLLLDIGNTQIKAAFAEGNKLIRILPKLNLDETLHLLSRESFQYLMISAVGECPTAIRDFINEAPGRFLLHGHLPLPFRNHYQTPHTLGTDRIAAIAGGLSLFPGVGILAIDAGSCITYDVADAQGDYWGGSISPGLQMRCRAMHTFTARLPLVSVQEEDTKQPIYGNTTKAALQSGALYGTIAEITQMIRMYEDKFGTLQTIICGGDAPLLSRKLKISHQVVPELIFIGLNRILLHNVS